LSAKHLFVYGTLRRGCDNPFAQMLSERGDFLYEIRLPGRLFDFGPYPGARPAVQSSEKILGDAFYLKESGAVLGALDDYEGPEFERTMLNIGGHGHGVSSFWIYWYVGSVPGRLIPSGDWLKR
jgi:gamma-glutamylcyclotransferase (GGCT)/AIG2-like uncharacterized protein YtfP